MLKDSCCWQASSSLAEARLFRALICQGGGALPLGGGREKWLKAPCIAMRPDRCKNPLWFYSLSAVCVFAWILPISCLNTSIPMMQHCYKGTFMLSDWRPSAWSRWRVWHSWLTFMQTAHQWGIIINMRCKLIMWCKKYQRLLMIMTQIYEWNKKINKLTEHFRYRK